METMVAGRWNRFSSEHEETKALRKIRAQFEKEGAAIHIWPLMNAEAAVTELVLKTLTDAGLDYITDGNVRWDSIFDVARYVHGCSDFTQLTRIPKTNHFHRMPQAALPLKWKGPILFGDMYFAKEHTTQKIVCTLPGPISMALQTIRKSGVSLEAVAKSYARVFNKEIKMLLSENVDMVRIEEPLIAGNWSNGELLKQFVDILLADTDTSRVAIATWLSCIPDPRRFFELPFGAFLVDFVETEENYEALKHFPKSKKLIAGIVDARHPYVESQTELQKKVAAITHFVSEDRVILAPNADLDFLPWKEAEKKAKSLVTFARNWEHLSKTKKRNTTSSCSCTKKDSTVTRKNSVFVGIPTKELRTPSDTARLFIPEIPFPTSHVGSLPQNQEVRKARAFFKQGALEKEEYLLAVLEHTACWMNFQRAIDLTIHADGELLREDMAVHFSAAFGGTLCDFVPSYENRCYHPVVFTRPLQRTRVISVDEFATAQLLTKYPVKAAITGPATLADWALLSEKRYYQNPKAFRKELASALREEIADLIAAGTTIIQVDEPALTTKPEMLFDDIEAIRETIRGFDEKAYLILHLCYSDMEALHVAFPHILELPFHQIHLEMANRNYALLSLVEQFGFAGKDIGLGVVDVHTNRIETVSEIVAGVERVLPFFDDPKRIWLLPDCGLKERTDDVAKKKLRVMCEAAEICREQLI